MLWEAVVGHRPEIARVLVAAVGRRRIATLANVGYYDGTGLACVAGIDAQEAVRRLAADCRPSTGCQYPSGRGT
ncbi:hypothetical protein [Streptomyces sp. NPDC127190]|uniref:hypothetical protein n=1 Tax=unclassified Streptomyces TaxID=2593676 RepID=UPI0036423111